MLTRLDLGTISIIGVSVGGVYTSICVPELSAVFDAGIAPRSFVGAKSLFISHGHADHVGALPAMIGVRGLSHMSAPRTFLPEEIRADVSSGLEAFNRGQRRALSVPFCGMVPGQVEQVQGDLYVRAFRTLHSVPSLGFLLFRRVNKLKKEFLGLGGSEIGRLRKEGADLFEVVERPELGYVTDSLIDVLDDHPGLYECPVLILECTFLDDEKSTEDSRKKYHVHLDEIVQRAARFKNDKLVLMHFSQAYQPKRVHQILSERLPASLLHRTFALCPSSGAWPG